MSTREREAVVIGAGLTGLTCAMHLKELGIDVEILEKENRIGGLMQTEEVDSFIFEQGPSTGTVKHPEVAELFDRLGEQCTFEPASVSAECRLIWKGNRFYALPSGLLSAITTPLFTLKDKLRILGEPWRNKGTDPNESVGSLAERRLGKSFVDYAVDPFLSGVYAGDPYSLPTRLALPKLYHLEQQYGGFVRGSMALAKKKKSIRDKRATKEVFSTVGGFRSLINALGTAVGLDNISLECDNITINLDNGKYVITCGDEQIIANYLITTCPSYALPSLLQFIPQAQLDTLNNLYYAPVIEIGVGIKHTGNVKWNAFGGLVPSHEKKDILGILMPSACFTNRSPEGGATYAYFIGGAKHPEHLNKTDAELEQLVNQSLHLMLGYPQGTYADVIRIYRHKYAIPQYTLSTDARLSTIETLQQQHLGLYIAGNLRDGIGMGDRIKQAIDVAEAIASTKDKA